jgi:crotonobetainyl-CoA:carnitine CoA-transferase CaiB-like acyl-CoA transferase
MSAETADLAGPLTGLRVVELASEWTAYAGKLLADLGAETVLVEPPGGHHTRRFEPFLDDEPGPERSLWFWHYNTSKRGVTVDSTTANGRVRLGELLDAADILLHGDRELDVEAVRHGRDALIVVSVTPFGRNGPRAGEHATDLTLLAAGGPVWSCGYDDHSIPPVRGGGNQALHIGGAHAAMAALVAMLHRNVAGVGQHVDVNLYAAANVTTEAATYEWLVARDTVQRQTCRHAGVFPTASSLAPDVRGRLVHTGVPPRTVGEFEALLRWLEDLGLADEYPETFFLKIGRDRGGVHLSELAEDVEAREIFAAGRNALIFIASTLEDRDFFVEGQRRGLAVGVIYAPEDVVADPHFEARGFPTPVHHEDVDRTFLYPGAPFRAGRSPWRIAHRAPHVGEHDPIDGDEDPK